MTYYCWWIRDPVSLNHRLDVCWSDLVTINDGNFTLPTSSGDFLDFWIINTIPRWWFQSFFYSSPRKLGKIPMLTNIFSTGWFNHQLLSLRKTSRSWELAVPPENWQQKEIPSRYQPRRILIVFFHGHFPLFFCFNNFDGSELSHEILSMWREVLYVSPTVIFGEMDPP